MTPLAQQIEALLFTAGEAVSLRDLSELTHTAPEEVITALREIDEHCNSSGLALTITDTHAHLTTSTSVAEFLSQFVSEHTTALSKAALETLSLIAYRGPIARSDIDTIRGVDSRRMTQQLLHRGLIRQVRTAGEAAKYELTEECLAHLGITKRSDLPAFDELSRHEGIKNLLELPS